MRGVVIILCVVQSFISMTQDNLVNPKVDNKNSLKDEAHSLATIDFQIFPNPASNELNIVSHGEAMTHVFIINSAGKVVEQYANQTFSSFDISHLEKGIYMIVVNSKNDRGKKRLIKQ